jgi:hypothetical protein
VPYRLRRASGADAELVWALLREAADWLRDRGSDQWSNWTTWEGPNGKVTRALAAGATWLLYDGEHPVGTVTLQREGDPDFWTDEELREPAYYLSKLVICRAYAGRGLGALLLEWSRDRANREGVRWVRFDAWRSNPGLREYYLSQGWAYVRDVDHPGRSSGALFQLPPAPMAPELATMLAED